MRPPIPPWTRRRARWRAAFAANALGPALLADATRAAGIPLVHVSTDYVFDGIGDGPYAERRSRRAAGRLWRVKLAGEHGGAGSNARHVILRTAWVLSRPSAAISSRRCCRLAGSRSAPARGGGPDRLPHRRRRHRRRAQDRRRSRLIEDKGAPVGTYHFVNAGEASWHALARGDRGRGACPWMRSRRRSIRRPRAGRPIRAFRP